jgi:hypothetical protein
MAQSNDTVAAALQEFADLLAISGGDPYRVRHCAEGMGRPGRGHQHTSHCPATAVPTQAVAATGGIGRGMQWYGGLLIPQ